MVDMAAEDNLSVRRTPLFSNHAKLGAKFTPFAGWDMPVLYSGVIAEHHTVRTAVGLFDVSHMGEIFVSGAEAKSYLQFVTSNDINLLVPGKAQYGFLLNDRGGVVDDIITYCFSETKYLICVNASNVAKDFAWLLSKKVEQVEVSNLSEMYAQLALQGPFAEKVLGTLNLQRVSSAEHDLKGTTGAAHVNLSKAQFPSFTFQELSWVSNAPVNGESVSLIVARTGYTGEDGFEIFCETQHVVRLWEALLESGESYGIKPIGLGARDTLRLEACLPLYGHELKSDIPALASGFGWAIKLNKGEFIGRGPLLFLKERSHLAVAGKNGKEVSREIDCRVPEKLVGFQVIDKGIVREEAKLFASDVLISVDDNAEFSRPNTTSCLNTQEIGYVTSGTHSPTFGKAIGLAYVALPFAKIGTRLKAEVRGKLLEIEVCETPFYKRKQ